MGEKRIRGQPQKEEEEEELVVENEGKKKKSEAVSGYEQFRDQRIKENMERLQKLGILDLSRNLKPEPKKRLKKDPSQKKPSSTSSDPPRRSSRLQTVERVVYVEKRTPKKKARESEEIEIHIEEGSKPEIYTEEDMKLLGDSKTAWTLMVDGYGEDGERIYDPFYGKSCHQCRQKTLGHRTSCSTCTSVQGQFCGDCLYTRYGENILEANQNPSWICPVCRGICNCSRCRRAKGWAPTSSLYKKVTKIGFKSVAHYLIQTRQFRPKQEEPSAEGSIPGDKSPSFDIEAKSPLHAEALDLPSSPEEIPDPKSEEGNNVKEDYSDDEYQEESDKHDSSDEESDHESGDD
ncbi:uncharacterized protein LOC131325685 isoform X1 [Rhododendron vialii]|uniref:uncharacterized protein LOC131325685 isoform X1 n=1 Tax=Rhododendron vialii TaxID=182163 RepID=UPI00265DB79C|nr:uncharacterized protein LOC131325685 isoform X1 [Rhododendron vialii]